MRNSKILCYLPQGGKKTPYERGYIAVRSVEAMLPKDPTDNTHVYYSADEIARRMTKVRLRHMSCEDRLEQQLLQGEYKYFSGKKIHYDLADIPELVSLLQNFAYFGFFPTRILDEVIKELSHRTSLLTSSDMDRTLSALATLNKLHLPLVEAISGEILKKLDQATVHELCGFIDVLAYMKSHSEELLLPIARRALAVHLPPPQHAALCQCLSRLPLSPDLHPVLRVLEQRTHDLLPHMSSLEVAHVLCAMATLRYFTPATHGPTLDKWVRHGTSHEATRHNPPRARPLTGVITSTASERPEDYTPGAPCGPEATAVYCTALRRLRHYAPGPLLALVHATEHTEAGLDLHSAAAVLVYLSEAAVHHAIVPLLQPLLRRLYTQAVRSENDGAYTNEATLGDLVAAVALVPGMLPPEDHAVSKLLRGVLRSKGVSVEAVVAFWRIAEQVPWAISDTDLRAGVGEVENLLSHVVQGRTTIHMSSKGTQRETRLTSPWNAQNLSEVCIHSAKCVTSRRKEVAEELLPRIRAVEAELLTCDGTLP